MNPMKEALAKRRGKGIEVAVEIGKPAAKEEEKTDMAPAVEPEAAQPAAPVEGQPVDEMAQLQKLAEMVKENPEASAIVASLMQAESAECAPEAAEQEEEPGIDEELTSDMTDYDKQDVAGREKPRSLGERAKKAALERLNK